MISERISIIGTGNVAQALSLALRDAGHTIKEVVGRSEEKTNSLAHKLGTTAKVGIASVSEFSSLYILAVSDDALESVIAQMPKVKGLVVHTSGTVSSRLLKNAFETWGVFYPLQTFTPGRILDFNKIPLIVFGSNDSVEARLKELSASIGSASHLMKDIDRRHIHLAAVMVNNFTNHLLALAGDYLKEKKLPHVLLDSLAQETIAKAIKIGAPNSQTGPAKRKDIGTVQSHLEMLEKEKNPHLLEIYQAFSASISEYYGDNKG